MKIKSTYRDKGQNFTMNVIREDAEHYYVQLDKEWQSQFQEGNKIKKLRKCLIGKIYEIIGTYQLSMF